MQQIIKKYWPQIAVGMMMLIASLLAIGLLVKVGNSNKEIAKLQTQIKEIQNKELKLKVENNRISKVVDELAIGFSNILNRVNNLTKEAETKSEIIFTFSKQIKEIQNKELKLKVEIKALEKENKALKVLLTNTGIAVARNKKEVKALEKENKSLKILLKNTWIAIKANQDERIKNGDNIYKLQNSLRELKAKNKKLKDQLNSKIDWYEKKIKENNIAFGLINKSQPPESELHN